jgi:hypothetical protein
MNKVTFSTFDRFVHDAPVFCDICATIPPAFTYALVSTGVDAPETKGYCCGLCAPGFLRRLEQMELCQWEAEEAALEDADILDEVELVG